MLKGGGGYTCPNTTILRLIYRYCVPPTNFIKEENCLTLSSVTMGKLVLLSYQYVICLEQVL